METPIRRLIVLPSIYCIQYLTQKKPSAVAAAGGGFGMIFFAAYESLGWSQAGIPFAFGIQGGFFCEYK
jgi:hypothetical protein